MKIGMPAPSARADSSVIQYRSKLPADLRETAHGRTVRITLPAVQHDPEHVAE